MLKYPAIERDDRIGPRLRQDVVIALTDDVGAGRVVGLIQMGTMVEINVATTPVFHVDMGIDIRQHGLQQRRPGRAAIRCHTTVGAEDLGQQLSLARGRSAGAQQLQQDDRMLLR